MQVWVVTERDARAVRDSVRACGGVSGRRLVQAWPGAVAASQMCQSTLSLRYVWADVAEAQEG